MRKSATSQTEKALVAYVQTMQGSTALETVSIYAGSLAGTANTVIPPPSTLQPATDAPAVITPPSLILTGSNSEQIGFDSGVYELKLTACLATEIFDEQVNDTEDVHRERIEALRDMLEDVALVQSYVNPPTSGTDSRAVQNYTLSAIMYEDEDTKYSDSKIETEIYYYVCACPADS